MAVTFFEKWLEEKKKYDPKTGKEIFPGDDSDKLKKVRADINKRELAKRMKNAPAMKKLGKGDDKEYSKDNPAPNTEVTAPKKRSDAKLEQDQKNKTNELARKTADTDTKISAREAGTERTKAATELTKAKTEGEKSKTAARNQAVKDRQAKAEKSKQDSKDKIQRDKVANVKTARDRASAKLKSKQKITSKDGSVTAGGKLVSNLIKTADAATGASDKLTGSAAPAAKKALGHAAKRVKVINRARNIKNIRNNKPQGGALAKTNTSSLAKTTPDKGGSIVKSPKGQLASIAGTKGVSTRPQKSLPPSGSGGSLPAGKPGGSVTAPAKRAPGTAKSGSGLSLGQQARNNPELKRKMIQQRMGNQKAAGQLSTMKKRGSQVSQRVQQQKPKPQGAAGKFAQGFRDGVRDTVKFAGKVKKTLSNQYDWRDELVSEDLGGAAKKVGQVVGTIEAFKKKSIKKKKPKKQKTKKSKKWQPSVSAFGSMIAGTLSNIRKEGFSNWREEFLHEVEEPEMGETDQKEPKSKSKKKDDDRDKKVDVMKGKNKVEVNPKLAAESSVMIQDADGNDFLEVIDVIKAEPLVPVKEGKINGNGKQEKFNRAMNAYRKAQRAGNLSNKDRVDRLKDNAKIRKDAEKKEKKGKQYAGGQVYEDRMVSIARALVNEISLDTANTAWNARKDIADKVRKVDSKEASKHDKKAANTARIIAMKERPSFGTTPKTTARQKRLNKIWEKS